MTEVATTLMQSLRLIAADIKLAHSVFAMPFALLAAFMAAPASIGSTGLFEWWAFARQLVSIVCAMFLARSVAMLANRLIDSKIDKSNPRTANRAIPSGRLPVSRAIASLVGFAAGFVGLCGLFVIYDNNWWPLILSLPVLLWISAYGYFKRFTALCHLYLGSSLALSPIAAAIAIDPHSILEQPSLWLLAGMVLCWVAGFDIIYAIQDVDVDRRDGLYSIPAQFGVSRAMWVSRLLHAGALACLIACVLNDERLGLIFGIGIILVAALLLYEHLTVARWGTTRIALAFFTLNGIISCVLGTLGIVDVLVS